MGDLEIVRHKTQDEIGKLAKAFENLIIQGNRFAAEKIASGDMTADVEWSDRTCSDKNDEITGKASEVLSYTNLQATGSKQVSDPALFCPRAAEQASAVEELTVSLEQIANK